MSLDTQHPGPEGEIDLRTKAVARLEKKRRFKEHLIAYVAVNVTLWAIWGVVFATTGVWFPWPLLAMLGWGIGLAFHAWDTYGGSPYGEDDVRREIERLARR